jgi:hypothetical protein
LFVTVFFEFCDIHEVVTSTIAIMKRQKEQKRNFISKGKIGFEDVFHSNFASVFYNLRE